MKFREAGYELTKIKKGGEAVSPICGVVLVSGMTREMRETLEGARKWLVRIHERRDDLPKSFLDNCDPKPIADKIHELLSTPAPEVKP